MRIALIGFGQVGGSVALALRRRAGSQPDGRPATIVAWSRTTEGPRKALAAGVIDGAAASLAEAIVDADLIVLAVPPLACLALLDDLAGPVRAARRERVTITDVASTKGAIVQRADDLGLPFVGGHPMAGRETSGYGSAIAELFIDRPWVVCPGAASTGVDVARVEELALACGARPFRLDPATHDAAVAAISHLPLVLSAALAEAIIDGPSWPVGRTLAASGWRDMTRLARGDATMGGDIAATNGAELASSVRAVRRALDGWLDALERPSPDPAELRARFEAARRRLEDE